MPGITSSKYPLPYGAPLIHIADPLSPEPEGFNGVLWHDNQYFQILIIDINEESDPKFTTELVTKTKGEFREEDYNVITRDDKKEAWLTKDKKVTIGESLPTSGAKVDPEFLEKISPEALRESQKSTIRFFLQTRKVSQLVAKTWLSQKELEKLGKWEKIKIDCIRSLILSCNLRPEEFDPEQFEFGNTENQDRYSYLIKPSMRNFNGIRLSLLLAGQAYIRVKEGDNVLGYLLVSDSVMSTYETVNEYSWQVSWDTFYASRVDLAQPGLNRTPPYFDVTLAYPPRPDGNQVTDANLEKWGYAKEKEEDYADGDTKLYFYPEDEKSVDLGYVVPPYPYIPMSCAC